MKYNFYQSDRESIIRGLEALEGVFVFPSQGYELSSEDTSKFAIECILISYDADNDKPFQASFLKHLARLDEHAFYAVLETDNLNKEKEITSSSGSIVSFIGSLNYHPFFVTDGSILICEDDGESFEDHRYGDLDRFVGNGHFNPLFVLLDDVVQGYVGETEYQTKKFENAVIALQWVASYGFPYESIIDWDTNKITDVDVREKVVANDVPFDINFIVGNPEHRFCRLIRFGLREFMLTKKRLLEKLLNLDVIDSTSSLILFEIIKESITDRYITNVRSLSSVFVQSIDKDSKKYEIFSPAFEVSMRISQPEGFTEKFLEEIKKHPTILGGMRWELKPVKTLAAGKQRYEMDIYAERRVNILDLSKTLEELRRICIRLLINSDLDYDYLIHSNVQFVLKYLEITIPNINQKITTACMDMFDKEFGVEQAYARKIKRLSDPGEGEIMFRLEFGFLSPLVIDWLTEDQADSARLDRSDSFTRTAINYALSGNRTRSLKLFEEIDELFNADRNSDMPTRFHNYIKYHEKDLVPNLTKKHPMAFMSDEDYNLIKEDVEFFMKNCDMFEDVKELTEDVIRFRKKLVRVNILHKKLKRLGIYKEKDLSYLDDVCKSISLFFGAQYRKSLQSA